MEVWEIGRRGGMTRRYLLLRPWKLTGLSCPPRVSFIVAGVFMPASLSVPERAWLQGHLWWWCGANWQHCSLARSLLLRTDRGGIL